MTPPDDPNYARLKQESSKARRDVNRATSNLSLYQSYFENGNFEKLYKNEEFRNFLFLTQYGKTPLETVEQILANEDLSKNNLVLMQRALFIEQFILSQQEQ